MGEAILQREMTFALGRTAFAQGQQFAQISVGRTVLGPDQNVGRAIDEDETAARRKASPASLAAIWPRTTPASELRSVIAIPPSPSREACTTSSSACDAPRRKEKLLAAASST
jgi:hypothetical protein